MFLHSLGRLVNLLKHPQRFCPWAAMFVTRCGSQRSHMGWATARKRRSRLIM